jgi:hypothetical protein
MREQVEARLTFLATGDATPKNIDVMKEVLDELKEENLYVDYEKDDDTTEDSAKEDTDLKKRKASTDLQDDVELEEAKPKKKKKHKKKKKKHKKKKHKKKEAAIETE